MPAGTPAEPDRNIRLVVEYDGGDFDGWQIQATGRTVQGELTRALQILLRHEVTLIGAGRTDAGTHAAGQVAHFHTGVAMDLQRLCRGLNGLLPQDIAVRTAEAVDPLFHARFSALSKRYRYRIRHGKAALDRHRVWSVSYPLSLPALQEAAAWLPGRHDFRAFCRQDPVPDNPFCQVSACGWSFEGPDVVFDIEADRFLRHMVRILVGTMAQIGGGRRTPAHMGQLLRGDDRRQAGPTAPARGLCLVAVQYP